MSPIITQGFGEGGAPVAPSVPVLSVADNGDGSGGVATVSGSDSGTTNVIYTEPYAGAISSGSWTSSGGTTGDGTADLSLPVGWYFGFVSSTGSGGAVSISELVYFDLNSGTVSVHYQCLEAVQAAIQAAVLVATGSVLIKKLAVDRSLKDQGVTLPAIILSPGTETMDRNAGVVGFDDVVYPVQVVTAQADNQESTLASGLSLWLKTRQNLARGFRQQPQSVRTMAPTINNVWVDPRQPVVPEAWKQNLLVSILNLNFLSREPRGFNT